MKAANNRTLEMVHATLTLLAPFFLMAMVGCKKDDKNKALDFGPAIAAEEVEGALLRPMQNVDPYAIKIGQFVHYAETQGINASAPQVVSDTGQTVVAKTEGDDRITYTIVEHKVSYGGDSPTKASRELELVVPKPGTPQQSAIEDADEGRAIANAGTGGVAVDTAAHARRVLADETAPLKALAAVFGIEEKAAKVTYHNLRVGLQSVSPPTSVASRPGCENLSGCRIRMHSVAFDQVIWESEKKAEKIAFEFWISEDVPYLAALMNRCATLFVPVETQSGKTTQVLLRQCSPVENFRFEDASAQGAGSL